jgi:RimJ/RimL family protein N-acetyltransferase
VTPDAVTLREVLLGDLSAFYEHQRDPAATAMVDVTARDLEPFMTRWAQILADETITARTALVDGAVAGHLVSWDNDGRREVGYWLGREFWGRGVATRALAAFLGLETTRPLQAHTAAHNIASRRVLEKCGFEVIGDAHPPADGGQALELDLRLD